MNHELHILNYVPDAKDRKEVKVTDTFKFCKFCDTEHPLTKEFWRFQSHTSYVQCKERNRHLARERRKDPARKKRLNQKQKEWRENNRERWLELCKDHYQRNRNKIIKDNYEYTKRRRKVDPCYDLAIVLRQRFNKALKNEYKAGSAVQDLGCSVEEFKEYLEKQFYDCPKTGTRMTWENRSKKGWHIDHIKPLASFDLTDPEQLKQALHYTNLQPLWSFENYSKGANL